MNRDYSCRFYKAQFHSWIWKDSDHKSFVKKHPNEPELRFLWNHNRLNTNQNSGQIYQNFNQIRIDICQSWLMITLQGARRRAEPGQGVGSHYLNVGFASLRLSEIAGWQRQIENKSESYFLKVLKVIFCFWWHTCCSNENLTSGRLLWTSSATLSKSDL